MTTTDLTIVPIETLTLRDHNGETAFVVDPQRDIDRVLAGLGAFCSGLSSVDRGLPDRRLGSHTRCHR